MAWAHSSTVPARRCGVTLTRASTISCGYCCVPVERMMPGAAAACTKILKPKVVYLYHYDQDYTARLTNPKAQPRGLPGGITVAQSLQAFRDAMKGESTEVRMGAWYP